MKRLSLQPTKSKPDYAKAMELRIADKELDAKFGSLPDNIKWSWLAFACKHKPNQSLQYARDLVNKQ